MTEKPRLIEVAFPLKQASVASVHEKNVRHGHLSTLHIWPARRPLAACRAALLATLLPDPGDPDERKHLLARIGGEVVKKVVEEYDGDGNVVVEEKEVVEGGVLAWGQESDPLMDEFRESIRRSHGGKAPKVLDPFAGGGAIPLEAMRLGCEVTASDINPVAWYILKCTLEYPHKFAGKKWPLPKFVRDWPDFVEDFLAGRIKKRQGKKKGHFSDPKQLALMELPEADLAWHVRAWGRWVFERAKADLSTRYPLVGGEPTVAYLWSRTARDKVTTGRIPLLKTFWLSRKKGRRVALLLIPAPDKSGVGFRLLQEADLKHPERIIEEYPFLKDWEVTAANFEDFLKVGTMNRSGVWSPVSGRPGMISLTTQDLRRQGQQGLLGIQMTSVVVEAPKPRSKKIVKRYRLPTGSELKAADVQIEDLHSVFAEIPFGIPDEPTPAGGGSGASRAFSVQKYGLRQWKDLFTGRQLLALGIFVKHTRDAVSLLKAQNEELSSAMAGMLTLVFGKFVDYMSTLCLWSGTHNEVHNTITRYALPITWDFAEANPFTESARFYSGGLEVSCRVLDKLLAAHLENTSEPVVRCSSALTGDRENRSLIFTDPPYYDAIPYSDLMDYFLVWQKRITKGFDEEVDSAFSKGAAPKWDHDARDGELIEDESRHGGDKQAAKAAYEEGMFRAFQQMWNQLDDSGRLVVVFANKEVDAWETMVAALVRAGFVVSASWPIQTERSGRMRGNNSAALASSVWLVCRKRPKTAPSGWEEVVIDRMKQILFDEREALGGRNILQYYFDLGIRGPDFIWAALGPALEAYSAHPFVKKTAGGIMTVPEFLKEVRKLVLQFSLGELPGFHEIQQETRGRGENLELDPVSQYYLLHRASFGLDPAPAGACILYANACGKNESELKVVWNILEQGGQSKRGRPRKGQEDGEPVEDDNREGKGSEFWLLDWEVRGYRETLGESKAGQPAPLIDRLHRLMFLFKQNRTSDVQSSFERWGLANERAFKPLLQAVRELALRDKNDTERRLVEALATQVKMSRRTVVMADGMKDQSLFEQVEEA